MYARLLHEMTPAAVLIFSSLLAAYVLRALLLGTIWFEAPVSRIHVDTFARCATIPSGVKFLGEIALFFHCDCFPYHCYSSDQLPFLIPRPDFPRLFPKAQPPERQGLEVCCIYPFLLV